MFLYNWLSQVKIKKFLTLSSSVEERFLTKRLKFCMIVVNWWNKKTGANAVMVTETMFSSLGFYLDYFVLLNFLTNFIPS